jgi:hypothetical protein
MISLLCERVYGAVAQKRPWCIRPSRCHCIATGIHAEILKWAQKKWVGAVLTGFAWLSVGTSEGSVVNTVMNLWVL